MEQLFLGKIRHVNSELSLVNSESTTNKQTNDNKDDSQLSWIIASLGQVAHFTSVVIRNVLATSGWVRSAHTAPYAKSTLNSLLLNQVNCRFKRKRANFSAQRK